MQLIEPVPYHIGGEEYRATDVHNILKRRGGVLPVAGNTLLSVPDYLQGPSLSAFQDCFAPLRAFTSVWDPQPYSPRSKSILKYIARGSATLVDETANFQQGGSEVAPIECAVSHYSQPWPLSNADLHSGLRQADLFFANAQELAKTLMAKFTTLLTVANFPAAPVTALPAAFNLSDAARAYGAIKGFKSLVLDADYFASLSHGSPRGFQSGEAVHGWQGIHEQSSGWASAGPKVRGVALAKPAIILVTGYLEAVLASNIERTLIGLPGMDLAIELNSWFAQGTRTAWRSLDCIFGVAKGDGNAAVLVKEP